MGSLKRRICFLVFASGLVACSTRLPVEGVRAFYRYDYPAAVDIFRKKSTDDGKDYVLYNLGLLSSSITGGDYWDAERAAANAERVMWSDAGAGRGAASLATAEAVKVFKGEPFEKAMTSIYRGVLQFNEGELDNARAAFSKAALAIRQKKESNREDFALPFLLQAKLFLKQGDRDNAKIAIEKAKKVEPNNPYLSVEKLEDANAIFLIELGRAPLKVRTGPGDSLATWVRARYPEKSARVTIDGEARYKTASVGDLTEQALTKGSTGKDTIQATKGVAREVGAVTAVIAADAASHGNKTAGWVALGAGLFALADQSQADIRQWELLPDRIEVAVAKIEPGMHTFIIDFQDAWGRDLSHFRQVWYHIPVRHGVDQMYLFRSGPWKKEF